jgi:predicted nuclease of predicted toxin-antitoxin system
MEWARQHDHIVFTHDMDFAALLAVTGAAGPSVLQVRAQDVLPDTIGRDVVRVLTMRAEAFAAGAIVTIDKVKSRVRVLPIRRRPDDSEPA